MSKHDESQIQFELTRSDSFRHSHSTKSYDSPAREACLGDLGPEVNEFVPVFLPPGTLRKLIFQPCLVKTATSKQQRAELAVSQQRSWPMTELEIDPSEIVSALDAADRKAAAEELEYLEEQTASRLSPQIFPHARSRARDFLEPGLASSGLRFGVEQCTYTTLRIWALTRTYWIFITSGTHRAPEAMARGSSQPLGTSTSVVAEAEILVMKRKRKGKRKMIAAEPKSPLASEAGNVQIARRSANWRSLTQGDNTDYAAKGYGVVVQGRVRSRTSRLVVQSTVLWVIPRTLRSLIHKSHEAADHDDEKLPFIVMIGGPYQYQARGKRYPKTVEQSAQNPMTGKVFAFGFLTIRQPGGSHGFLAVSPYIDDEPAVAPDHCLDDRTKRSGTGPCVLSLPAEQILDAILTTPLTPLPDPEGKVIGSVTIFRANETNPNLNFIWLYATIGAVNQAILLFFDLWGCTLSF
ncbi:hypothetical protein CONLIGDRAFT_675326 [Coniochaeta ligniaria NRRL 30616]|uniref:Uncharacterized protein n=1 Tax=Coniochaeta ligniaria NRRL 30616 TaxID=1408157 RepID=A0A1J7J4F7_9PEZI|nr:hypothetical protein CONLIGDRAFT_675326 [Coniochaeta ligniaria NRRL 30616]